MPTRLFDGAVQSNARRSSHCASQSLQRIVTGLAAMAVVLGLASCSASTHLMPTPTAYTNPAWNPFADVPPALQGDTVSVLYITDRLPEETKDGKTHYGSGRSYTLAYGDATVRIGDGVSWEELVVASRTKNRSKSLELNVIETTEVARGPEMQIMQVLARGSANPHGPPPADPATAAAEKRFLDDLSARLAQTPRKEVFLFVHGFDNSFDDAVMTTAQLWHFFGREGVPVCYTPSVPMMMRHSASLSSQRAARRVHHGRRSSEST